MQRCGGFLYSRYACKIIAREPVTTGTTKRQGIGNRQHSISQAIKISSIITARTTLRFLTSSGGRVRHLRTACKMVALAPITNSKANCQSVGNKQLKTFTVSIIISTTTAKTALRFFARAAFFFFLCIAFSLFSGFCSLWRVYVSDE